MSETITQVDGRARTVCPGLRVDAVLRRTNKAVLLAGVLDNVDVVAKVLIDPDAFWHTKFATEIATYQAFTATPPPVPTPQLLAADTDGGVLVMTRLPGAPVSPDRYPGSLHPSKVVMMLRTARQLQEWTPPENLFPPVWDYPHRFHRYRTEFGLLTTHDVNALNVLVAAAGPMRMAHGDLLPANVLHTTNVVPAPAGAVPAGADAVLAGVLDWEFTGRFLPGLDLALLWIALGQLPAARRLAQDHVGEDGAELAGFWANVATVCVRELRIHAELPAGPLRSQRLQYLRETWQTVQTQVFELAGRW